MEYKDDLHDEFQDELEKEQVTELKKGKSKMKSPPQAFELVDEFADNVEDAVKEEKCMELSENSPAESAEVTMEANEENATEFVETNDMNGSGTRIESSDGSDGEGAVVDEVYDEDITEEIVDEDVVDPEVSEDYENIDPLAAGSPEDSTESDLKPGKRKNLDNADENSSLRKSSRLRSKPKSSTAEEDKPKEKPKMLQKPSERPTQLEEEEVVNSDSEPPEDQVEPAGKAEQLGDPARAPGLDASRLIDQDLLQPFLHGWVRECVVREGRADCDVQYWPPKDGVDHGPRNREARRKRRSKIDQERYFEEFRSSVLSVVNFTYVRRPLGLNNEAYERIRQAKPGEEVDRENVRRSTRKVNSYKEVAEHEGLVSSEESDGEEEEGGEDDIEEVTDFDLGLPLVLQLQQRVTPLREEHKKRRKWPDRARCLTPPRAADMPWTKLDDDPLGVWTELAEERKAPPTPPPLRALRLTQPATNTSIAAKLATIRAGLVDPLERVKEGNRDLAGSEQLASHDLAVRKYKNYRTAAQEAARQDKPWRPQQSGRPVPPGHRRGPPPASRPGPGSAAPAQQQQQGFVKVRLPMSSSSGKRPVVELVMLTNGKYQPIKFTNNRQVTEQIPKRLFDQANTMRKTLYQRSVQVPKIGAKQVFLAINPTPGGVRPYSSAAPASQTKAPAPAPPQGDQVSILVRPSSGGNAVLLNVPRSVALKVKVGTTLSFSASNDQKYTVIDNKMHPPVGRSKGPKPQGAKPASPAPRPSKPAPPPGAGRIPTLPSGVSIRPVKPSQARPSPVAAGRPAPPPLQRAKPRAPAPDMFNFTPCSPFCPGASGIPELECTQCHSLFHPKCVSIPAWQVASIKNSFKCKRCAGGAAGNKAAEVIDLD